MKMKEERWYAVLKWTAPDASIGEELLCVLAQNKKRGDEDRAGCIRVWYLLGYRDQTTMTPVEAAEIILAGERWIPCEACAAIDEKDASGARLFIPNQCKVCEGSNAQLHPDYKQACELLGKPLPPVWREKKIDGVLYCTGPILQMGGRPTRNLIHDGGARAKRMIKKRP